MKVVNACWILMLLPTATVLAAPPHTHSAASGRVAKYPTDSTMDAMLEGAEEVGPNEQCTEEVTGQFWYKACIPQVTWQPCKVDKWVPCWVYDPDKCCNVLKRKKIKVDGTHQVTSYVEKLYCAKISIPRTTIAKAPKCDCPDLPSPYTEPTVSISTPPASIASETKEKQPAQTSESDLVAANVSGESSHADEMLSNLPVTTNSDLPRKLDVQRVETADIRPSQAASLKPRQTAQVSQPRVQKKVRQVATAEARPAQAAPQPQGRVSNAPVASASAATGWQAVSHPVYYRSADGRVYQNGTQVTYYYVGTQQPQVYSAYRAATVPAPQYYYTY